VTFGEKVVIDVPKDAAPFSDNTDIKYYGIYIYQNSGDYPVKLTGKAPTYANNNALDWQINHSDSGSSKDNGADVSFT